MGINRFIGYSNVAAVYSTPQGIVLLFFGILMIMGAAGHHRRNRLFDIEQTEKEYRKYQKAMFITGLVFILLSLIVDTVISWFS